jgi:hypothetical protein
MKHSNKIHNREEYIRALQDLTTVLLLEYERIWQTVEEGVMQIHAAIEDIPDIKKVLDDKE